MACAGFQLERFAYDLETDCGSTAHELPGKSSANRGARCTDKASGIPKYSHALFRRSSNSKVFAAHVGGHTSSEGEPEPESSPSATSVSSPVRVV